MSEDPRPKHPFVPVIGMQTKLEDSERYGTGRKVTVHFNAENGVRVEFESCGVTEVVRMSPEACIAFVSMVERMRPGLIENAAELAKMPLTPPPPTA